MEKTQKSRAYTIIGMSLMASFILTKFIPSIQMEGGSIFIGIASFFLVEYIEKTREKDSGLRFTTIIEDLKKPGVLLWMSFPIISSIGSILLGKLLFGNGYVDHVLSRTDSVLSFEQISVLIGQLVTGAFGEEIAFRGFFVGKGMKIFPFQACMLLSSFLFSIAHYAPGDPMIVAYDLIGIFIDALIYSMIYKKTGNCVISVIAHFLLNLIGLVLVFALF